jgi:secondary thiamine-phosphate synthase enzyme
LTAAGPALTVTCMEAFTIQTRKRNELLDITSQVREIVRQRKVRDGLCVVYCPHTTAAITINENADPDVGHDILACLDRLVPQNQPDFRHAEDNSDSHIKASLVGPSVTVLIDGGDLVLGRWQGIFFCEFDGPRSRTVQVQVIGQ